MSTRFTFVLAASLLFVGNALADDGAALMKKNNCLVCHQTAAKAVGPSLKDIAAKYKGDDAAVASLEKKVRTGGAGNWGKIAMAPTPAKVTDAEIKAMVGAILATK